MEFARDLNGHFKHWLAALEGLCDLVVLEHFKDVLPAYIATYVSGRQCVTAARAAASADEYLLLFKGGFRERATTHERSWRAGVPKSEVVWRGDAVHNN